MRPLYARDFVFPPVDGSLLLHETLEYHLERHAELPMYAFHEEGKETETELSYLEFSRACHRVAHALAPKIAFGEGAPVKRPVVAFMALADVVVYQAIVIGLMRIGVVVSLLLLYLRSGPPRVSRNSFSPLLFDRHHFR